MSCLPSCRAAAAGLVLCISSFVVQATDTVAQVVITANRQPQPRQETIADLVVIDADTLARSAAASLPELLQRQAGIEIAANGGPGQPSALFLRGTNANHVVVLIDGVRVNSATTGTNALEHLPLAQIERIEVLRGPASSLYGADAVGGVIQIFTRSGERAPSARLSLGSDRLRDASAGAGGRSGVTEWSLQVGAQDVRAFSSTNDASAFSFEPDRDPYRHAHAGGKLRHEWQPGHTLGVQLLASDAVTHFDAGPGTDDLNRQRITSVALSSEDRLGERWRSTLRLARGSDHLTTEGAFPGRFDTDQDQLGWQHDIRFDALDLVAGVEWRRESVSGDTAFTQTSRRIGSAYGGASTRLGAHRLEGSLRMDRNSQFGTRTTGRAGYGLDLAPDWRLAASAGTGFHAPSFNDLYFPLTFGFQGNPDLRPERSRGADLALRFQRERTSAALTFFVNRIDDLIAVDPSFSTVVNVNRARIRGATLVAQHAAAAWRVSGEWTWQDPRDIDADTLLVRRARRHGHAGAAYAPGPWEAGLDLTASGARFDSAANTPASRMGGYALVDLFARWSFSRTLAVSGRVRNAGDKRYELAQGYNTAPRQFVVTLEASAW
jgi:vitamin B12 transporter